jgi:Apea-like HEPN
VTPSEHDSVPILCVTPLYHFSSDAPELVIREGLLIRQFADLASFPFDEEMVTNLRITKPDFLLFQDSLLSQEYFIQDSSSLSGQQKASELIENCLAHTREMLRLLRLFKPGHLHAGETFVLMNSNIDNAWHTLASGRASDMDVDYFVLRMQRTTYVLNSIEIPFLKAFQQSLWPVVREIRSFPAAEFALYLYGSTDDERFDVIRGVTALEALLTKKEETEGLTYRLSMRVANLLGHDVDSRKEIFRDIKKFYGLRSKMVHGTPLDSKLRNQLTEVDSLRETLRKVLLSVMALFSVGERPEELPDLLDDLAFDDEKRKQVQAKASQFLHIG